MAAVDPCVERVETRCFRIPTKVARADGTLSWRHTVVLVVRASSSGCVGVGWTYGSRAGACLIEEWLAPVVQGGPVMDVPAHARAMARAVGEPGPAGVASGAISAVDIALWDLKARVMDVSLGTLLGAVRTTVPVYASVGPSSRSEVMLRRQLEAWRQRGAPRVKIRVGEDRGEGWGTDTDRDLDRVEVTREVVGNDVELYVDANGAFSRKQAVRLGRVLEAYDVRWFEEPVPGADTEGLGLVRDALDLDVTAGEHATRLDEVRRLSQVVDCLQLDATRIGGITGWLRAAAVAQAFELDVSANGAPHVHAHVAAATPNLRHLEWPQDHVGIEQRFLEGALEQDRGSISPDTTGPGHGFALKEPDLDAFRVDPTPATSWS